MELIHHTELSYSCFQGKHQSLQLTTLQTFLRTETLAVHKYISMQCFKLLLCIPDLKNVIFHILFLSFMCCFIFSRQFRLAFWALGDLQNTGGRQTKGGNEKKHDT